MKSTTAWMVLVWVTSVAQAQAKVAFDLPVQPLADSLRAVGAQTNINLLFDPPLVAGKRAPALKAEVTADEALTRLLVGTGIKHEFLNETTIVLAKADAIGSKSSKGGASASATSGEPRKDDPKEGQKSADSFQVAQVDQGAAGPQVAEDKSDKKAKEEPLSEIVVTGTHIRGAVVSFSPLKTFDRRDLEVGGFGNVSDLLTSVTQNFGGGISPETDRITSNGTGATAVNLRGLGTEATLVLVDGHRLAPSGLDASFVDISMIPTAAIARVDVLTDGASAIYGSDAIGGVVNIIMRKDFDGIEARARYATLTQGDSDNWQEGITAGHTWDGGHFLLTYEDNVRQPLYSDSKSFGEIQPPGDEIIPHTHRRSVFASGALDLTSRVSMSSDLYFNSQDGEGRYRNLIGGALFQTNQDTQSRQFGGNFNIGVDLPHAWRTDLAFVYGQSNVHSPQLEIDNLGDLTTQTATSTSKSASLEATAGGPLFDMGGGLLRMSTGAFVRRENYDGLEETTPVGAGSTFVGQGRRTVGGGFVEVYAPVVSAQNRLPGLERLDFDLAGRVEHYSDVGSTANPKFGALWSPLTDVNVRATYGKSFQAPRLPQLTDQISGSELFNYIDPGVPSGQSIALLVGGSSSNLTPEKATTWTAGIDWEPHFVPNLKLYASYYNIAYTDRIATPLISFDQTRFVISSFPIPPERNPSAAEINQIIANGGYFFNLTGIGPGEPAAGPLDATVLLRDFPVNVASTYVSGIDFGASYGFEVGAYKMTAFADATYIDNFTEQFSPSSPRIQRVSTVTYPVNLKARAGISGTRGPLSAAIFVNWVNSYKDNQRVGAPAPISSWTTADFSVSYRTGDAANAWLRNVSVTVAARNIFDTAPPRISLTELSSNILNYDPANASPEGRVVSIQLTKTWQ